MFTLLFTFVLVPDWDVYRTAHDRLGELMYCLRRNCSYGYCSVQFVHRRGLINAAFFNIRFSSRIVIVIDLLASS